jgi:hypothetical protein
VPSGQLHWPAWQTRPAEQATSQAPQCAESELRLKQAPAQALKPSSQATPHAPFEHTPRPCSTAELQPFPQAPQWAAAALVSTQLSPQRVSGPY